LPTIRHEKYIFSKVFGQPLGWLGGRRCGQQAIRRQDVLIRLLLSLKKRKAIEPLKRIGHVGSIANVGPRDNPSVLVQSLFVYPFTGRG
jgi:hypothetical protein